MKAPCKLIFKKWLEILPHPLTALPRDSSYIVHVCVTHTKFDAQRARYLIRILIEHSVKINKQTVDPDQMPRSVASDLCLHCLPMSHKKIAYAYEYMGY